MQAVCNRAFSTAVAVASGLSKAHVYDGDDGVYTAHKGDRSSLSLLKSAKTTVKVPHKQKTCKHASKLANGALQGSRLNKQPVICANF